MVVFGIVQAEKMTFECDWQLYRKPNEMTNEEIQRMEDQCSKFVRQMSPVEREICTERNERKMRPKIEP